MTEVQDISETVSSYDLGDYFYYSGQTLEKSFLYTCSFLEKQLLPIGKDSISTIEKVIRYTTQFILGTVCTAFVLPWTALIGGAGHGVKRVFAHWGYGPSKTRPFLPQEQDEYLYIPQYVGVATAEYQVNGSANHPNCNWAEWEKSFASDGSSHIEGADQSLGALNHWHQPEAVISRLKELGVTSYRFSVERSMIEPVQGYFNTHALEHYKNFCQELKRNNIEPFITLHHFTEPIWLMEKGAFEKEENIDSFISYCQVVFDYLCGEVTHWATINEPAIYVFQGYTRGEFPPGNCDIVMAGKVLRNMLEAHCRVYETLKRRDGGKESQIGLTHDFLKFCPYNSYNPIEVLAAHYVTQMTHEVVMRYFSTGEFCWQIPFYANIKENNAKAPHCLDFLGIQYYSYPLLRFSWDREILQSSHYPEETMTNMPFRFYPDGLADAIKECQDKIQKPIYITEVGIDDTDKRRIEYYERIFKIVSKALKKGVPVQGIYAWTLEDNFEWNRGWGVKYGLFSFDPRTKDVWIRQIGRWFQELLDVNNRIELAQ